MADLAHHVLLRTLIQSMIWHSVSRVHQGHTQPPVRSPQKLAFQWDVIIHKDIQLKCLKKRRMQELTASNRASLIKQLLISGEIVLIRVAKPKANTLIILL